MTTITTPLTELRRRLTQSGPIVLDDEGPQPPRLRRWAARRDAGALHVEVHLDAPWRAGDLLGAITWARAEMTNPPPLPSAAQGAATVSAFGSGASAPRPPRLASFPAAVRAGLHVPLPEPVATEDRWVNVAGHVVVDGDGNPRCEVVVATPPAAGSLRLCLATFRTGHPSHLQLSPLVTLDIAF